MSVTPATSRNVRVVSRELHICPITSKCTQPRPYNYHLDYSHYSFSRLENLCLEETEVALLERANWMEVDNDDATVAVVVVSLTDIYIYQVFVVIMFCSYCYYYATLANQHMSIIMY